MEYGWLLWLAALGLVGFAFQYCEKKAAMRGSKRTPLPVWQDKGLRLLFLGLILSPLCMAFGRTAVLLGLLYLPSYLDGSEKTGSRRGHFVRQLSFWQVAKRHLNLQLVHTTKLDPTRRYIIAVHPHGVMPWGGMINLYSDVNNISEHLNGVSVYGLAASFCFCVPLYRDFLLSSGQVDAARYCATNMLALGHSISLCPGGASEALYAHPGTDTLVLKSRRGFIRLAIETGAELVPVYSFNETSTYGQLSEDYTLLNLLRRKFQNIFGISVPLVTNIIPHKANVTTVIGQPIQVPHSPNPTEKEVEDALQLYIDSLTALFDKHKAQYSDADRKLVVI